MYNSKTQTYSTILELRGSAAINGATVQALGYYTEGDFGSPVTFVYDTSSAADDNAGTVIKPTAVSGNGRWVMQIPNNTVNVKWFGARFTLNGTFDCLDSFNRAISYIKDTEELSILYIPGTVDVNNRYYFISGTITTDFSLTITGDTNSTGRKSHLMWPENTLCWKVATPEDNTGYRMSMKYLQIQQRFVDNASRDFNVAHGIHIQQVVDIDTIYFPFIAGDGLHFKACLLDVDDPDYGASDSSIIRNCYMEECWNGVYINGCDTNNMSFYSCSAVNCRRYGVLDDSFLGCLHYSWHFAYNGRDLDAAVCSYSGGHYKALYNFGATNLNKQPDINPLYWQAIPSAECPESAWDSGKTYYSGGPYAMTGENAVSLMIGDYTEEAQPRGEGNTKSIVIPSTHGANSNAITMRAVLSTLYLENTFNTVIAKKDTEAEGTSIELNNGSNGCVRFTKPIYSPDDVYVGHNGIGRFDAFGSQFPGFNFAASNFGLEWPRGTPYLTQTGRIAISASGPDRAAAFTICSVTPGTNPSSLFWGTHWTQGDIFFNGTENGPNSNILAWRSMQQGDWGTGVLTESNFFGHITPYQKKFTTTNDTPVTFFTAANTYLNDKPVFKIYIEILASDLATGDIWMLNQIITYKTDLGGVVTTVNTTNVETPVKQTSMIPATVSVFIDGTQKQWNVVYTGIAATTIEWTVTARIMETKNKT